MITSSIKINLLLSGFIFCFALYSNAQKTELSLNAYAGMFSFHGSGSGYSSTMLLNGDGNRYNSNFTQNVYGKKVVFLIRSNCKRKN